MGESREIFVKPDDVRPYVGVVTFCRLCARRFSIMMKRMVVVKVEILFRYVERVC